MKTIQELHQIIDQYSWEKMNAHVHTYLCDGRADMNVQNIAAAAKEAGIELIILTPHFHKQVSDKTETLYCDTKEEILLQLREEIAYYQREDGTIQFLLSTEADILSEDGELSLKPSDAVINALDLITPALHYNPALPLNMVHLTYSRDSVSLHDSGEYLRVVETVGGIPAVLEAYYTTQEQALLKCPYSAMLSHFFAAHSVVKGHHNWFGAKEEHLPVMKAGAEKILAACKKTGAMVDITGIPFHLILDFEAKKQEDGFLYDYQRWFLRRCKEEGILTCPGSDAHELTGIKYSVPYKRYYEE